MSCQNGHGARAILSALRSVDPTLPESDQKFWHKTLGTQGGGTVKASPEDSLAAIDAAWVAATKNNKAWSNLTPQERLAIQGEFRDLRTQVEGGSLSLTQNQVMKLGAYTAKHKKLPMITRVGVGLGAVLVGGLSMVSPAAAATNDGPIAATKANASLTHVRAKDGNCPTDFTLAKAKGTHKVTWQYPSKKVGVKKIKKGQQVCIYQGQKGVYKDGVLVALPANFPKNPTAEDIAALGLTKDTPVAPNLRIPQPKLDSALKPAELAEYVTPIAYLGDSTETLTYPAGEREVSVTNTYRFVEWEITGGQGVLQYGGFATPGGKAETRYVNLNPNGTTRVTQGFLQEPDSPNGGKFKGMLVPDYGQANLPPSAIQDWNLWDVRALDETGWGTPVGKYSNSVKSTDKNSDGSVGIGPNGEILTRPLWERWQ